MRVLIGMSGGVDSAAAALLLLRSGCAVEGLFMKNWEEDDDTGHCAAARDAADAQAVCDRLGIPLHRVNFAFEYWERVFEDFLAEHRAGRTPNPDVLCNREIKFKAFLEYALDLGFDAVATGHYARIVRTDDEYRSGYRLLQGLDADKDQSYFLYTLGQPQLARALFPLGEMKKKDVRALAREAGLPVHAKKDSTGICFIGERRFREFLGRFLPPEPGEIVNSAGQIIGRHDGLMYYTLGQRQGLGIGGRRGANGAPWYVAGKDRAANRLIVVQGHDHPLLFKPGLIAHRCAWIGNRPAVPLTCTAKIRYRQTAEPCTLAPAAGDRIAVVFDRPQRAVTPGQSIVFYKEMTCLGGAVIEQDAETVSAH